MCKWRIDILLKNGTKLVGIHKTECDNSGDVVRELFVNNANWFSIYTKSENASLVVNIDSIAAMEVMPAVIG